MTCSSHSSMGLPAYRVESSPRASIWASRGTKEGAQRVPPPSRQLDRLPSEEYRGAFDGKEPGDRRVADQGEDLGAVPRARVHGEGLDGPHPRSAGEQDRGGHRTELRARVRRARRQEKGGHGAASRAQGRRRAVAGHRLRPRGRGHRVPPRRAARRRRRGGQAGHVHRDHEGGGAVGIRRSPDDRRPPGRGPAGRRILDRLVGYKLSPILWKKVRTGLSAGRVQSVALRLVVDREGEIQKFKPREYWTVDARLSPDGDELAFAAHLDSIGEDRVKTPTERKKGIVLKEADAREHSANLERAAYRVAEIRKKEVKRRPSPPFTTSTLQQEAGRKLGFSARKTMRVAQQLYEG